MRSAGTSASRRAESGKGGRCHRRVSWRVAPSRRLLAVGEGGVRARAVPRLALPTGSGWPLHTRCEHCDRRGAMAGSRLGARVTPRGERLRSSGHLRRASCGQSRMGRRQRRTTHWPCGNNATAPGLGTEAVLVPLPSLWSDDRHESLQNANALGAACADARARGAVLATPFGAQRTGTGTGAGRLHASHHTGSRCMVMLNHPALEAHP